MIKCVVDETESGEDENMDEELSTIEANLVPTAGTILTTLDEQVTEATKDLKSLKGTLESLKSQIIAQEILIKKKERQ